MRGAHVAVAGVALVAAALNGMNLAGSAYYTYAEQHLDQPDSPRTVAAGRAAAGVSAWSSGRLALAGWLVSQPSAPEGLSYYHSALRWAPADPFLWQEYATTLARLGRFDALEAPLERSQHLAPASPAVQSANAAMGLAHWAKGSPNTQAVWLRSMRYELDHDRFPFLESVVTRGHSDLFCDSLAPGLGEDRWCDRLRQRTAQCEASHPGSGEDVLCLLGG